MKFIVIISVFVVFGFIQCTVGDSIRDYRLSLGTIPGDNSQDAECITSGKICNNCKETAICIADEDGFNKIPVETCEDGESCLDGECTTDRNPVCEDPTAFICNNIGVFPDPYECQYYHFCVLEPNGGLKDYKTKCDGSYGYHAGTTFCQTKLNDNVCFADSNQFPLPLCLYSGQTASLSQNPSIYFICAKHPDVDVLYPYQYVCPHGGIYSYYECALNYKQNYQKLMDVL